MEQETAPKEVLLMSSPDRQPLTTLWDVSGAETSAKSLDMLEGLLATSQLQDLSINLNTGDLLLTPKILSKMRAMLAEKNLRLEAVFTTVPQTQQAALDEGLYVKSQPFTLASRKRTGPVSRPVSFDLLDAASTPDKQEAPLPPMSTLYLRQNLRSGQVVRHNGHLVLIGDVHAGSEVVADGDILIWGELLGMAHAGAAGNYRAEIRAVKIEAIQLRIGELIARRPDRRFYHKPVADTVTAEVARVTDGEIRIFRENVGKR